MVVKDIICVTKGSSVSWPFQGLNSHMGQHDIFTLELLEVLRGKFFGKWFRAVQKWQHLQFTYSFYDFWPLTTALWETLKTMLLLYAFLAKTAV